MRIALPRRKFVSALQALRPAVPTRDITPILKNVRIAGITGEDLIGLQATDLEIGISVAVEGDIVPTGIVLLPFDRLSRMVNESIGDEFVIEERGQQVYLSCGTARWSLPQTPVEGWPDFNKLAKTTEPTFLIDCATFREAIRRTKKEIKQSTGTAAKRGWESGGLLCEFTKSEATFVGMNSNGLSAFTSPIRGTDDCSCLLPPRAAEGIGGVLEGGEAQVWVSASDLTVQCGGNRLYTRLMDGRAPPWRNLLKDEKPRTTVVCHANVLADAVSRAVIACQDDVKAFFSFGKECSVRAGRGGLEGTEIIAVKSFAGEEQTVPLSGPAVLELLKCCREEETVTLSIVNPERAVQFSSDCKGWLGMVMPMGQEQP